MTLDTFNKALDFAQAIISITGLLVVLPYGIHAYLCVKRGDRRAIEYDKHYKYLSELLDNATKDQKDQQIISNVIDIFRRIRVEGVGKERKPITIDWLISKEDLDYLEEYGLRGFKKANRNIQNYLKQQYPSK